MTGTTTTTPASLRVSLRGLPILAELSDQRVESLARVCHRRVLARGDVLFRAGQFAREALCLWRGLVKVHRGVDGDGAIVGLLGPPSIAGLAALVSGGPYPGTAITLTPRVEVLAIPSGEFLGLMAQEPVFANTVNRALATHSLVLKTTIDVITAGSVAQRIASLFLTLAERFGDELADGTTVLPVVLTRGELASMVDARVETVIRTLSEWDRAGLVHTTSNGFVVRNLCALRDRRSHAQRGG